MTLYAAWKGAGDDQGIWWSSSDDGGDTWAPQWQVYGVATSHGPALTVFEKRLYLFWKGMDDDAGIYWSVTTDGNRWSPQQNAPSPGDSLSRFGTNETPAVIGFEGGLHLFWKGVNDLGIWHSTAGSTVSKTGVLRLHWAGHDRLGYVGPGAGGSLNLTRNAPAVAAVQRLYLAGQRPNNDGIFVWSRPPRAPWDPSSDLVDVPGVGTSNGPALIGAATTFIGSPDNLLMYWKGAGNDQAIWHAASDDSGRSWSKQSRIANVGASHRPALAASGQTVHTLWKGARDDEGLYTAYCVPADAESGLWRSPRTNNPVAPGEHHIPNVATSHRPALASF